jgi:DNA invertase Pin-like site-specific DNA recombinase
MKARRKQRKPPLPDIVAELRQRRDRVSREAAAAIVRLRDDVAMLRERGKISERILAGMRRARREGRTSGGSNAASLRQQAEGRQRAEELRPLLVELGALSATAAAAELNRRQVETPQGGRWHAVQVIRARKRLEATS